ncbi:MAG: CerR family C-terminal domain-containing protein [Pseudomonadota bacterium]|nr:CerR family C-terminal domain-containing protein [Pseudomonadota bacterium]
MRAATEVFAEHGFEAATIREICRRAGANVAAVHYHFGDKKRLYTAIFDTVFALLRARRTAFLAPDAPPEARLHNYISALFDEIFYCDGDARRCTQLSAIYLTEMLHPTEVLDRVAADHMRRDAEELYGIVGALLDEKADSETVVDCAASVVGQILYYYHAEAMISRLHPDRPPVQERIDELVDHVWHFSLGGIKQVRSRRQANDEPALIE